MVTVGQLVPTMVETGIVVGSSMALPVFDQSMNQLYIVHYSGGNSNSNGSDINL
jgi:hypothetical protein